MRPICLSPAGGGLQQAPLKEEEAEGGGERAGGGEARHSAEMGLGLRDWLPGTWNRAGRSESG